MVYFIKAKHALLPEVEGVDVLVMFEAAVELLLLEEADEPLLEAELWKVPFSFNFTEVVELTPSWDSGGCNFWSMSAV